VTTQRWSEGEFARLEAAAAEAGLSRGSFIRAMALGDAGPRARRAPTIEKQVLGAAIAELNRVGNNVNQIARAVNIGKDVDGDLYQAVAVELRRILATVREAFYT
jgi:hypothetical protein